VRRRAFIAALGGSAVWPLAARAQQQAMPVVGFLGPGSPAQTDVVDAVRQGLRDAGVIEGQNMRPIEFAWAGTDFDRLPALAADLVRRPVNMIVAIGAASAVAAKGATTNIPVVFYMGEDPVSLGVVSSFNRPGGNLTGVATLSSGVVAKRLELLREIAPHAEIFATLINPKNPSAEISTEEIKDAARRIGKDIQIVHASSADEIDQAFAALARLKTGALLIAPDGLFIVRAAQVAELASRHAIAASHERRAFPAAGGLMSYGANQANGMRLAGALAGRVLKGERPADLPVLQPTKFELVINLKAATALGLTPSPTLLATADEVID
jgi:putative tryptophan/tyrosine transport system substrate-binding protein